MTLIQSNPVKLTLDTKIDLTGQSQVEIAYVKPDGTEGAWTAAVDGDPTLGVIFYQTSSEIDQVGLWSFWSIATFATSAYKGEEVNVEVMPIPSTQWLPPSYIKSFYPTMDDYIIAQLTPIVLYDIEKITGLKLIDFKDYWKPIAAAMLFHKAKEYGDEHEKTNVTSFRLGDYAISYSEPKTIASGYPASLIRSLNPATIRFF